MLWQLYRLVLNLPRLSPRKLSQEKYIRDLAEQYKVSEDSRVSSPLPSGFKIQVKESLSQEERNQMKVRPFLSLLSALLWVCRCTRYDIAVSLCILSRPIQKVTAECDHVTTNTAHGNRVICVACIAVAYQWSMFSFAVDDANLDRV